MELTVHDLVRLASPASIAGAGDAPAWVFQALDAAPWAVVRRAAPVAGFAPLGIRGATRDERYATTTPLSEIAERRRPEDLRQRRLPRAHPVFDAMARLEGLLDATGCTWGPGGSAGYELATGRPTLGPDSDLDLILRCDVIPERAALASLLAATVSSPVRFDMLIETPTGGVALGELLGDGAELLLRTAAGPRLTARAELFGAAAPC